MSAKLTFKELAILLKTQGNLRKIIAACNVSKNAASLEVLRERERDNKVDTILYGRYIIYKIVKTSHLKNYLTMLPTLFLQLLCRYEQLNVLSYLHIF